MPRDFPSRMAELPPRTRRIPQWSASPLPRIGTTSAHAENTIPAREAKITVENYLRARGEYSKMASGACPGWELPPRTRRILPDINQWNNDIGTTSAHAENTPRQHAGMRVCANYLRARGEYGNTPPRANAKWELPPRTRRIPTIALGGLGDLGTTSAHAENTGFTAFTQAGSWNYLRARGEYAPSG